MAFTIQLGRLLAMKKCPYFARGLCALNFIPTPGMGTMGVDKYFRVYYDPEVLSRWSPQEGAGVILHELEHVLRNHGERAKALNLNPKRANIAWDLEINDGLVKIPGIELPEGALLPSQYNLPDDKLGEWYYNHLPEEDEGEEGEEGDGEGEEGDGGSGTSPSQPGAGQGNCGSGADGVPRDYELPPPEAGDGAPGLNEMEAELVRRSVAQDIQSAAKNRGDIHGNWERIAQKLTEPPKVSWQKVLRVALSRARNWVSGNVDYTFRRPSRRSPPGIILPSMHAPSPDVAVVIDTSGSMSQKDLGECLREIEGILKKLGQTLRVVSVDSREQGAVKEISNVSKIVLGGGGGTDMRVGINLMRKQKIKPNIVIVATDGYTPWPAIKVTEFKLIILLVGRHAPISSCPSWATVVSTKD